MTVRCWRCSVQCEASRLRRLRRSTKRSLSLDCLRPNAGASRRAKRFDSDCRAVSRRRRVIAPVGRSGLPFASGVRHGLFVSAIALNWRWSPNRDDHNVWLSTRRGRLAGNIVCPAGPAPGSDPRFCPFCLVSCSSRRSPGATSRTSFAYRVWWGICLRVSRSRLSFIIILTSIQRVSRGSNSPSHRNHSRR